MIDVRASSASPAVLALIDGPLRRGVGLGHGYIDFDGYVVAVTPPGAARMPNGVECALDVRAGEGVTAGEGWLIVRDTRVRPASVWNPRPTPGVRLHVQPQFVPEPARLAGRGPGLTPAGDDVLIGYAAGLGLFAGAWGEALGIAETAAPLTTALSATLLRHAVRGELPEPAHALIERGDPSPLLDFGHSSGRYVLLGLGLASIAIDGPSRRKDSSGRDQVRGRRGSVVLPRPEEIRWVVSRTCSRTSNCQWRPQLSEPTGRQQVPERRFRWLDGGHSTCPGRTQ